MCNQIEKIIDKITKLLALSKSSNENEAATALLNAQKLMVKYDISVEDVNDASEMKKKEELVSKFAQHKWDAAFRKPLASVISSNFKCKTFLRNGHICFYGFKTDVEIATRAFEFAYTFIQRGSNRAYEKARSEGRSTRGIANTYALGFIQGIRDALEEQCRALMIVTPAEVEAGFKELSMNFITKKGRTIRYSEDEKLMQQARQDGYDAFATRKVTAGV